jgi:hypothetical protein
MEGILKMAKIKRAELMMLVGTLVEYYADRSKVFSKRASRLKYIALASSLGGLLMLGTFVVKSNGSLKWLIFGVVSIAFCCFGALLVGFYEKRVEWAKECLDRIGELHSLADYIRTDSMTEVNARARKRWYTTRIGVLKCEYLDLRQVLGGLEFEELLLPPDAGSKKLMDTISELEATLKIGDEAGLSNDITDGIRSVVKSLAD